MTKVLCSIMDCPFNKDMACQKEEVRIYRSDIGNGFCMTHQEEVYGYEHESRGIFLEVEEADG